MNEYELKKIIEELQSKVKELSTKPVIEQYYRLSKDGAYLIHETRIVDIKPLNYMDKVLDQNKEINIGDM